MNFQQAFFDELTKLAVGQMSNAANTAGRAFAVEAINKNRTPLNAAKPVFRGARTKTRASMAGLLREGRQLKLRNHDLRKATMQEFGKTTQQARNTWARPLSRNP